MVEIYLGNDRTTVIGPFAIAPEKENDPTVGFDPEAGTVTVGGVTPSSSTGDGRIKLRNDGGIETAALSASDDDTLELRNQSGDPIVTCHASHLQEPRIEVANGNYTTTRVEAGRLSLFYKGDEATPALEADETGTIRLATTRGRVTCRFAGRDAALVLSTGPEVGDGSQEKEIPRYGGGELVLQSADRTDLQIHAQGELDSDYGADVDDWPRIHLDGPDATLELGRHRIDSDRPAENGELRLREDGGNPVLHARATEDSGAEIVFEWVDGTEAKERGSIRSHPDGLAIHDAGGHEAVRITNTGEIKTRKEVTENADI
ncbi:MAG: hypothetical protein V5A55_01925 [Halovenus sp.]